LGLRAEPLLIAALVAGQADQRGRVCLGRQYLVERTGLAARTLDRALQRAEQAGAIHKWRVQLGSGWRLFLAPGPSRSGDKPREQANSVANRREASRNGEVEALDGERREAATTSSRSGEQPVANRRTARREQANSPSQSGEVHPDCPPDCHPDGPTDGQPDAPGGAHGATAPRKIQSPEPESPECRRQPDDGRSPIADLTDALFATRYRIGIGNALRRRWAIHERAADLVPTGLDVDLLEQLVRLANEKSHDDPGGLLAHWLDGGTWREVLDEQGMKQAQAGARRRGRKVQASVDGDVLGGVYGGRDAKPAASVIDDVLQRARKA
jgi:hypothetical protein